REGFMSSTAVEQDARSVASEPALQDLYRLLLLRRNGSELTVAGGRPPFTLPCVEIPRRERVAENVIVAVSKRYGIPATCLFTPARSANTPDADQPLYQVMETREAKAAATDETRWVPVNSLLAQSFADEQDFAAITDTLR